MYKEALAAIQGKPTATTNSVNLDAIKQACQNKYQFDPVSENLSDEAQSLEALTLSEFQNRFQRMKSKFILIGKTYSTIINGNIKKNKIMDDYHAEIRKIRDSYKD